MGGGRAALHRPAAAASLRCAALLQIAVYGGAVSPLPPIPRFCLAARRVRLRSGRSAPRQKRGGGAGAAAAFHPPSPEKSQKSRKDAASRRLHQVAVAPTPPHRRLNSPSTSAPSLSRRRRLALATKTVEATLTNAGGPCVVPPVYSPVESAQQCAVDVRALSPGDDFAPSWSTCSWTTTRPRPICNYGGDGIVGVKCFASDMIAGRVRPTIMSHLTPTIRRGRSSANRLRTGRRAQRKDLLDAARGVRPQTPHSRYTSNPQAGQMTDNAPPAACQ